MTTGIESLRGAPLFCWHRLAIHQQRKIWRQIAWKHQRDVRNARLKIRHVLQRTAASLLQIATDILALGNLLRRAALCLAVSLDRTRQSAQLGVAVTQQQERIGTAVQPTDIFE